MSARPFFIGDTEQHRNETITSINPADGSIADIVCHASSDDVENAVKLARATHEIGTWRKMHQHERAEIMRNVARRILADKDRLAVLQMSDNGKPIADCNRIVDNAAAAWIYYASVLEAYETEVTPSRGDYMSHTILEPYGVVAAITPWNSPLMIESYKIAPALAAGNCVILKPSEETPQTSLELMSIANESGLPCGTLTVLPGTGASVGMALIQNENVNMITFTGGTKTGVAIAEVAAKRLVPVALELGGKSPQIVLDDADIELAVEGVTRGICGAAGQSCTAGSRLLVHTNIYAEFKSKLTERMSRVVVGMPDVSGTEMGPLASFAHRDRVAAHVQAAINNGATVELGGDVPGHDLSNGAFYTPTLLTEVNSGSQVWNEEIFGPVICAQSFSDEATLRREANCGPYGLAAGIWTKDFQKAWKIGREIEAGTIWINTYEQSSISTPFGGFKQSGIGREKGAQCLRLYSQLKSFYWGMTA